MKILLTIVFGIISFHGSSQPGPSRKNLNEINGQYSFLPDIIVIDSTSDLSKIEQIKELKVLSLDICNLKAIPKEFVKFTKTESLTIWFYNVEAPDLSFLNEFPDLKYLRINNYGGEILSHKKLVLDSLMSLQIGYCPNLYDIEAIRGLNKLEELFISNVANLKRFPKFSKQNLVRKLELNHMSNGRQFNEEDPQNFKTDIRNIKHLAHLEELTLGSLTFINDIPDFLPAGIKKLEITGWGLHHWRGDKVEIKNLDNLKLYPRLKELKLYNVHLSELKGNFENLSLDHLLLWYIPNLADISGVFSFNSIKYLKIESCYPLRSISGPACKNVIEKIEIEGCQKLENIDFLFTCQNLNFLAAHALSNDFEISKSVSMDKIPNISIFKSNEKIRLYKKDNVWQTQTIKE